MAFGTFVSNPSVFSVLQKIRSLFTANEKLKWIGIFAFAFCTSLLEMITALVIVVFAQIINQPETGQRYLQKLGFSGQVSPSRVVFMMAIACGLIYLVKNIIAGIEVVYQNFTIQKMHYQFKNKLLHRYAAADYEFYLTRNSALGLNVIGMDAEQMFSHGIIYMASILSESAVFLFLVGVIIYMNPSLALAVFCIGGLLSLIITKVLLPHFYRFGQRFQESALHSNQALLQFFHGFKEIVLLGKREAFIDAYRFHSRKKARVQAIQKAVDSLPRMVIEVLFVGLFVATIAVLCLENESPTQMIGILGGYLYVGFRLMPGLNRVINHLNAFKAAIPSIERIYDEYHSIGGCENYADIPDFTFNESITFNDVDFTYNSSEKNALSAINLTIQKGQCIGIVGETGSGKSTMVDLLLGLLKPKAGTILVDGQYPVCSYQWHRHIGYVPQSIYLTDDTIAANIAFGVPADSIDETQLQAAIDAAQLRKFVDQLPMGTQTMTGERGVRLSGGERQRIAIARALYRNPDVLVFDEATSALDNETEARLMETIHAVSQNRTVIMIAHRLTTLKDCDRIVKMNGGVLKEVEQLG